MKQTLKKGRGKDHQQDTKDGEDWTQNVDEDPDSEADRIQTPG